MSQGLNLDQVQQVHHIAQLALLALCARGVAGAEFEASPEVSTVRLTVHRPVGDLAASVEVEYLGSHAIPLGGMSL